MAKVELDESTRVYFNVHLTPYESDPSLGAEKRVKAWTDKQDPTNIREWMQVEVLILPNERDGMMIPVNMIFSKNEAIEFHKQVQKIAEEKGWQL